jgi:hypothetical protein
MIKMALGSQTDGQNMVGPESGKRVSMENFGQYDNFQIYPLHAIHELMSKNYN